MIDWRRSFRRIGVALNLRDPPNVPTYGWSYLDHLVAVYLTLNTDDPRADAVIEKSRLHPDDIKWGDIFLLENVILSLEPPEILERNAWIVRERFREITSCTIYDKYVQSGIPKDTDTPEKVSLLRADMSRIQDVLHWHYALIPIREHIRKSLTSDCILMVLAYTVIVGFALFRLRRHDHSFLAMAICVVYFGIIGGFVSSQRRMQSIPTDTDPLVSIFGLDNARYYLWLSPLLGGIFASILTLMFIAGVLQGTIFPDFHVPSRVIGRSLFDIFAWQALPNGTESWAKLFVWAFLAGFAERLVPDSLDRLSSKLTANKQQSISVPLGSVPSPAGGPIAEAVKTKNEAAQQPEEVSKETMDNALYSGEESPPDDNEPEK
ncbi:MAG TPA: hypothetical protein VGG42_07835 [Acidobacteriaceae bacterium]|jgi:hypothetical protein